MKLGKRFLPSAFSRAKVLMASIGTLVLILTLFTQPTFAAESNPHNVSPHQRRYYIQEQCLVVDLAAFATGPNQIDSDANVINDCPGSVTGRLQMYAQVTNCIPYPELSNQWSFSVKEGGVWVGPAWPLIAGCVICTNGIPTRYPPFTVRVAASAFGTWSGGLGRASSNYPAIDVGLSNNPPESFPPCP